MIFNNLNFAGVNSIDYGIYITGEAVYNVPERSVEFVSIAGRDGDLILDNGHFENIEVTYPAGCFGVDQTSFADKVRAFRNAIASKKGYQRLTDSYNPNEYRLATFVNGVEVEPTSYGRAGEFELVFNCQPFRYLMSGESEIEVTSGSKIANPCPFESKPLIEVEGYGNIGINDYNVNIGDGLVGSIVLAQAQSIPFKNNATGYITVDDKGLVNANDPVETTFTITARWQITSGLYSLGSPSNIVVKDSDNNVVSDTKVTVNKVSRKIIDFVVTMPLSFEWDYSAETIQRHISFDTVVWTTSTDPFSSMSFDFYVDTYYGKTAKRVGADTPIEMHGGVAYVLSRTSIKGTRIIMRDLVADSTASYLGHPTYIDCDLGSAYKYVDDEIVSLDAFIDLGSDLPILDIGENEITFDNTITDLKIIPRWRQI